MMNRFILREAFFVDQSLLLAEGMSDYNTDDNSLCNSKI